jgi:hypothetical protein
MKKSHDEFKNFTKDAKVSGGIRKSIRGSEDVK